MKMLAEKIAQRRKALGMSQKELAEKLNVSDKTLSRWETGKQIPDALIIPEIANALDMTISEIYGTKPTEERVFCSHMKSKESIDYKKILKLVGIGIAVIAAITALVICVANHNLKSKVTYTVEEVPMYKLTYHDYSILDWINECNLRGEEINLLSRYRYDPATGEDIACYLIYMPHGYQGTEFHVRYQLSPSGKVLKLKYKNTTEIIDDNYYLCYMEVVYNQEKSLCLQTYLDGERIDYDDQGNVFNVNWEWVDFFSIKNH